MLFKIKFSELSKALGYVNTVFGGGDIKEDGKVVIFEVGNDSNVADIIAISRMATTKTKVELEETEGIEDKWMFQVGVTDLNRIISSYSSLYKTYVEYITFETFENKIKIIVSEKAKEEDFASLEQDSTYLLNSSKIKEAILSDIESKVAPEEIDIVDSSAITVVLESLQGAMSNNAKEIISSINFSEEYIYVITSALSSFMKNKLGVDFTGFALTHSNVTLLKKLCLDVVDIQIKKENAILFVRSNNTDAFINISKVKIGHEKRTATYKRDNGILTNRLYLKDVLKRMSALTVNGHITITDDGLAIEDDNKVFSQLVPVDNIKGDVVGYSFKFSVPLLEKMIIGDDAIFNEQLCMYIEEVKGVRGYALFVSDVTNSWFSLLAVSK